MGSKVGPQAFQRMVSDCLKSLQPHTHIYIDDLLTKTRPKLCGNGKILDSKAYLEDHFQNVVKLVEKLEECHLKVRFEKCHLFLERIKYCGHVLHGGLRSLAPSKVDAVRNWPKPKTPKQMKGFLGVVNWYSIYIRKFSNIAAPLMTSLQGKYERVPGVDGRKGRCRVPRERNCIQWTPEMEFAFVQLKEALSAECELYIPSPNSEYRIHVDACDHGVGAVREQQNPEGEWKPSAFFSRKLEGKDGKGQRAWSTRKQDTYALVSCLVKIKSWIGGRKDTVYTDHKSLESWYKEDLCTLSGPLGRRDRWHEFLSRYHIEVVYKPSKDNTVTDGLSRWAYPAGLADDTNFHGSDGDQKGVMKQERELKEREEKYLAQRARDTQVQSDTGLLNAITAVGAVLTLQWLGYATVQALSAHQAWVQPCPSILECFHDSSQDIQDRQDKQINELAASIAFVKGCAANWSSETVSGYAAHLQARVSHLSYWPESEGLICAVSKVNIPPQSEILYEDWTEHYRDKFPDWDFESDPVISNWNHWHCGMRWDDDEKKIPFKGKIVRPTALFDDVVVAIHSYGHPRVQKTVQLFDKKFWCLAYDLPSGRLNFSPDIAKILGRCHDCQTTKARRGKQPDKCDFAPVPQYPFTSLAIDLCKLPECLQKSAGKKVDYLMVFVCRQTGYVLAIPCQEKGLNSKSAASLFLDRCVHMFVLPKEFICDNASIINSEFLKDSFAMSGVEQHSSVAYRPQSNGRAERAVQSIVNSLRQYLEQRGGSSKHFWVESLPLALWALNDLPGAVSGYSPHRLIFGGDPVGWQDCLPVSPQDTAEDAGQFFGRMLDERAEVRKRLEDLHAKEFAKCLAKHP